MKQVYVQTRDQWRSWLQQHHDCEAGIWLVFFKLETGKPTLDYESSVEEALCFGWIDSIIKKIDGEKYARKFTPRKPDSLWSDLNKQRVARMIEQGRMAAPGLEKIWQAKESGLWEKSPRPNISFEIPPEFEKALQASPAARAFFDQLADSYQKQYIGWIVVAKRPDTREKRIRESIVLLEKGEKLGLR